MNTENHLGWRTSIFDQLSTLLTNSPCDCFYLGHSKEGTPASRGRMYTTTLSSVLGWKESYLMVWDLLWVHQGCVAANELFLEPTDWIRNLDYADVVLLLPSMLEILVLALEILHEEFSQTGLEVNWSKTKIFGDTFNPSFQGTRPWCWGCQLLCLPWILHRCTWREWVQYLKEDWKDHSRLKSLDHNTWSSSISLQSKVRLYNVYIVPILLYGADMRSMTSLQSTCRCIWPMVFSPYTVVHIPYTAHITNKEAGHRTSDHLSYSKEVTLSVWTSCQSWYITRRPF